MAFSKTSTLLKASSYATGGLGANIVMVCKLSHPAKVSMPICLRVYGRLSDVKAVHPSNAFEPIFVTPFSIVMSVMFLQVEKA